MRNKIEGGVGIDVLSKHGFVIKGSNPNATGVKVRSAEQTIEAPVYPVVMRKKDKSGVETVITVLKPRRKVIRQLGITNNNGSMNPKVEQVVGIPKWMFDYRPGTDLRGNTPRDIDELFDYRAGGPAPIKPLTVVFVRQR